MPAFWYILPFSILGSVGAIGMAALFLFLPTPRRDRLTTGLISYAVGAATVFLPGTGLRRRPHP